MTHHWVRGGLRADRERALHTLDLPAPLVPSTVDAHRRLRGPYTVAGTLMRHLVPDLDPTLVRPHELEILSVAPELRAIMRPSRDTLTSLAIPAERTRFYSRLRTLRLAHGLVELIRDHLTLAGQRALVVENAEHADPTDTEFLSVLTRRVPANLLTVVLCTGATDRPDLDHLTRLDVAQSTVDSSTVDFVRADGVSDDPAARAAYEALDPAARAALHDQRAAELLARNEDSLLLGAIPYHREHGSDPEGAGAQAIRYAMDHCIDMGYYHATVELCVRGRALVDWAAQTELWWAYTTKMTTSLAALGRAEEAEALYHQARAFTASPNVHMQASYATAMLYTRHHEADRKDHEVATALVNQAIAFASLLPDPKERAFNSVFMRNGLALIEVHKGNLPTALDLVNSGLARLDRDLGPDEHRLHRSVLRYNRGQVYAALGRVEEALADYDAVIAEDPNYAEYHFDRGNLLRTLDRDGDALLAYERAMELSPPFPEVYYNRADIHLDREDTAAALADLNYVLELDPDFLDALINRAGLHAYEDRPEQARRDVAAGLAIEPDNPYLIAVLGQLDQ